MLVSTTTTTKEDAIGVVVEKSQTITAGQESSAELAENAKGEPKIVVKVYNADHLLMVEQMIASYRMAKMELAALQKELKELGI